MPPPRGLQATTRRVKETQLRFRAARNRLGTVQQSPVYRAGKKGSVLSAGPGGAYTVGNSGRNRFLRRGSALPALIRKGYRSARVMKGGLSRNRVNTRPRVKPALTETDPPKAAPW